LRYDWFRYSDEGGNRFVVFDPATVSLFPGRNLSTERSELPTARGLSWTSSKTANLVRSAYAIMTVNLSQGLSPRCFESAYALPVSLTTAGTNLNFGNAADIGGPTVSPRSIVPDYKDAYVQSYNFNIQQQLAGTWDSWLATSEARVRI